MPLLDAADNGGQKRVSLSVCVCVCVSALDSFEENVNLRAERVTNLGGVFAQRGHSANYYGDYPGNNPENHPPTESCTINSKLKNFKHLMLAMGPRDLNSAPYSPVHCSSHSMTSFQSSELTELPVVENSQLFAQRTVRPLGE